MRAAQAIKELRRRRGYTHRQLSALLAEAGRPILPSGLVKVEQGTRRLDVDDLEALARVLRTGVENLVVGDVEEIELDKLMEFEDVLGPFRQAFEECLDVGVPMSYVVHMMMLTAIVRGAGLKQPDGTVIEMLAAGGSSPKPETL